MSAASFSPESGERLLAYSESAEAQLTFVGFLPTGCFCVEVYVAALPAASNTSLRLLWTDQLNVTQQRSAANTTASSSSCQMQAQANTLLSANVTSQQTMLQSLSTISTVASAAAASNASTVGCPQVQANPGTTNSTTSTNTTVSGTLLTLLAGSFTTASVANLSQSDAYAVVTLAGSVLQQLTAVYVPTPNTTNLTSSSVIGQSMSSVPTPMEQTAFDSATSVVAVLLSLLSANTLNSSSVVTSAVSNQLASSLGSLVQSSQSLLVSGDGDNTDVACSRYAASVSQVHSLLNTSMQQTTVPADMQRDGSVAAASSFVNLGFFASGWQVTAGSGSGNASTPLSGGPPLSLPVDALSAVVGADTSIRVRILQVSGVWARCATANETLNSTDGLANSVVAAARAATAVVSSNIATIDMTMPNGLAYDVANLTQPITFQLVAQPPDEASASATVPSCSWYDEATYSWSTDGCNTTVLPSVDNTTTTVLCSCSHLTDFGVIYADAKDAAALAAVVHGFAGYLVLLVVYVLTCIVTAYQLGRLLHLDALKDKLMSRVISVMGRGSTATQAYHSRDDSRLSPATSGSTLVLIEHLLVFLISLCRAASMGVYYTFDSDVSFTAVSTLSILPLVGNMWVYSFVIFQWSAIYYNAVRGGGVGEADFSSNSLQRLRAVFYAVMSAVTAVVFCLLLAIDQSHTSAEQERLAFVGILVTLVVVGVTSALLFSVGLMLVYSLTRDFTSRHATKLFLLALTFSCTLLGQSLVLVHQSVTAGNIYTEFNKDNMMYYGLDAVGHVLVLAMFARSVQAAADQRKKQPSQASTTNASLKAVSSTQPSQASEKTGAKAIELSAFDRPSFHHNGSAMARPQQNGTPRSNSHSNASTNQVRAASGSRTQPPLLASPSRHSSSNNGRLAAWSTNGLVHPMSRLDTLNDDEQLETVPASHHESTVATPTPTSPPTARDASSPRTRFHRLLPPLAVPSSPSGATNAAWSPFRPLLSKTGASVSPSSGARMQGTVAYTPSAVLSPLSGQRSSWFGNELQR